MSSKDGPVSPMIPADGHASSEKADHADPKHVEVPFAGVVQALVAAGDRVEAGQAVAMVEAMKMEAAITATVTGIVKRLAIVSPGQVDAADLIVEIEPS